MRRLNWVMVGALAALCVGWGTVRAAEHEKAPLAAAPVVKTPVEKVLEECQVHPSVVHAGTPLEACMEAYGYVKQGDQWVKKPPYR